MSGRTHRRRPQERVRGFTLLELMVALTIGGLAITSIYAVGAASTRVFHQQHQLASAQTALRLAVNQVKRDLARAGFLSTPNIDQPGQGCQPVPNNGINSPLGTGRLAGISIFRNDMATTSGSGREGVDPTGKNWPHGFTVDDVVLMGNYESASEYAGASMTQGNPFELSVSSNWYAFQRDFTTWYRENPGKIDATAFGRAFAQGRMLRLRMPSGLLHFSTIRGVTNPVVGDDFRITLDSAVPVDCALHATGGWIAPVSTIHYFVRDAPVEELDDDYKTTTGPMAQLIREEVQPTNKATPLFPVANGRGAGTRVILDYVVGFNLEFTSTAQTLAGQPDQYAPGQALPQVADNDTTPPSAGQNDLDTDAINAAPERLRSVVVDIAVRTPEEDPTFPWLVPDGDNCSRMRCFQVFAPIRADDAPKNEDGDRLSGAARIRRMRTEVFLPNIANEGY